MHQLIKLRSFTVDEKTTGGQTVKKLKTYDAFLDPHQTAPNLEDLYKNIDKYLEKIPKQERFNIHYTLANCGKGKRDFHEQHYVAFDIDKIDIHKVEKYHPVILGVLGTPYKSTAIIFSGHGLHYIIKLKKPITQKTWFREHKPHYSQVLKKIEAELKKENLPMDLDSQIFEPRRMLRLPGTINRKKNLPDIEAKIIQPNMKPMELDLCKLSGIPKVESKDMLSPTYLKKYPQIDGKEVLRGCDFIYWMKNHPNETSEPQWYALLSILSRLQDGRKFCHEYSAGYYGYSQEETEQKIEQALECAGPRTCENINSLWEGCSKCAHWQKVNSPVMIRGKDSIATEKSGFHTFITTKSGPKFIPCYKDLRKFFERKYPYKTVARNCWVFNGKYYQTMENNVLEQFAQKHFDPYADNKMVREFRELVTRTHVVMPEWFDKSTRRQMNFQNCVLNLDTMETQEHDPETGFRQILPYEYNQKAVCPNFDKMLKKVTREDEDLEKVLCEWMGYAIAGDTYWLHKALILIGDGANGKSTFLDVIKMLVGADNYSCVDLKALGKSEYARQLLDGKFFNISEETPDDDLLNNHMFKLLSAGGEITVRQPYREAYSIRNKAKLLFACNSLPESRDLSKGFFRRFMVVPFNAEFTPEDPDFDPHILEKMQIELPGILNRALEGYKRLCLQQGFTYSKAIDKAVRAYRYDLDNEQRWADEHLEIIPKEKPEYETTSLPIKELYIYYLQDLKDNLEKPLTRTKFTQSIRKLIPDFDSRYTVERRNKNILRSLKGLCYIGNLDQKLTLIDGGKENKKDYTY